MLGLIASAKAAAPVWPVLSLAEQLEAAADYQARCRAEAAERHALKMAGCAVTSARTKAAMAKRKARLLMLMRKAPAPLFARDYAALLGVPTSIYKVRAQIEELASDPANGVVRVLAESCMHGARATVRYWVR